MARITSKGKSVCKSYLGIGPFCLQLAHAPAMWARLRCLLALPLAPKRRIRFSYYLLSRMNPAISRCRLEALCGNKQCMCVTRIRQRSTRHLMANEFNQVRRIPAKFPSRKTRSDETISLDALSAPLAFDTKTSGESRSREHELK